MTTGGGGGLTLAQVERVYSLPPMQLVRLSQLCAEQKRHESELEKHLIADLPTAWRWEVSVQFANRLVLRAQGLGAVKDTWLVIRQSPGSIELCTTRWYMQQPKLTQLPYVEGRGTWFVSHTSTWGICLRCHGVPATTPVDAHGLWQIDDASQHRIVLRTLQWYREHKSFMSAHRRAVVGLTRTPPSSPRHLGVTPKPLHFSSRQSSCRSSSTA